MGAPTDLRPQLEALLLTEDGPTPAPATLAGLGTGAAGVLAALIGDRPHDTKFTEQSVLALGGVAGAPEAGVLVSLLGDPVATIRMAALTALRTAGDRGHVAAVEVLLTDAAPAVRKEALKTAAKLGGAGSLDALRRVAADDREEYLRVAAATAVAAAQGRPAASGAGAHA